MDEERTFARRSSIEVAALEKELRDLSYVIAHDLGACFRQVSEFSKLLEADLGPDLSARAGETLVCIRAATRRCQDLLEHMTAYASIQCTPLERRMLDGASAVRLAAQYVRGLQADGCEFTIEPIGELYVDPKLFNVAIRCLLENAVKFRRTDAASHIAVRPAHAADAWRVQVVDNGCGLEAAYRDKAMMLFRQVSSGEPVAGDGVGLAVCRRIARRHGGDACVLATDGETCVELSFPKAPAPMTSKVIDDAPILHPGR